MELRELSFYKDFSCIAKDCPESCCHGWIIPLTEEDRQRFRKEKGKTGLKLRLAMLPSVEPSFNASTNTCPFLDGEGLCSLQLEKGHGYLPEVCRMYPRFVRNYGIFEEHYTDLSCIHSAALFLENVKNLNLSVSDGEPLGDRDGTNDDFAFLRSLDRTRTDMIRELAGVGTFEELGGILQRITGYAVETQQAFLGGKEDYLETGSFSEYRGKGVSSFPFTVDEYRRLMESSFYHDRLKRRNPTLYRLCSLYFGKYRSFFSSEGKWRQKASSFTARHPDLSGILAAYYAYYLYQYYFKCFEDYSFRKNTVTGLIHLNMVFLFSLLWEAEENRLFAEDLSRIIAVYNRRAYFNDRVLEEMYQCIV